MQRQSAVRSAHDTYFRHTSELWARLDLQPEATSCHDTTFNATLVAPDGSEYRAQMPYRCPHECTPDGIGSQSPVSIESVSLHFEWGRDPFKNPDGSVRAGYYHLTVGSGGGVCQLGAVLLSAEPSLDVIWKRKSQRRSDEPALVR